LGWRAVLAGSAVLVLACLPQVGLSADHRAVVGGPGYREVLGSIPGMVARTPTLLVNTAVQVCTFGAFLVMWGTFTVHAVTGPMRLSVLEAALVGLAGLSAGLITVLLAPTIDRLGTRRILFVAIITEAVGMGSIASSPFRRRRGRALESLGGPTRRPASINNQTGQPKPALWRERRISVSHEDLRGSDVWVVPTSSRRSSPTSAVHNVSGNYT
jgi:hypothetical protein